MKKLSITVYATVFFGCFLGKAQSFTTNTTGILQSTTVVTSPINLSQFEIRGNSTATPYRNGLITQNFYSAPSATQTTGNFGATARWNSMGSLNAGTQILNGFRTQTDGRGLTLGYSVASGVVSNPAIQWIGNLTGAGVSPGSLDFNVSDDPGGPGLPATERLVMRLRDNGNVIIADGFTANFLVLPQVKLGVYDGKATPSTNNPTFISTGAIYGVTRGLTSSGATGQYVAGVVGDVANASFGIARFGVLGIAGNDASGISANFFGVYSIGRLAASGAYINTSDEQLKMNVKEESSLLEKIMQLQPMTYEFNREKYKDLSLDEGLQHGIMAQNLARVFPEMVTDVNPPTPVDVKTGKAINPITYKGIKSFQLISVLIKGMQEQQQQIESLQQQVQKNEVASKTIAAVEKGFSLSQNVPNPFSSNTTISYKLPANTSNAILGVFDLNGKLLLQYNLGKAGNQINISGNTLTAGMYIYSLIVNGNEVMSKRMILTK